MLRKEAIEAIDLPQATIQYCLQNPVQGFKSRTTAQLRSVGNEIIRQLVCKSRPAFQAQLPEAHSMGVSYTFIDKHGRRVGISPAVSVIRDSTIMDKQIIVPAAQLNITQPLQRHYVLAILLGASKCGQGKDQTITQVAGIKAVGWQSAYDLRRFVQSTGSAAFKAKLAIAPVGILRPVKWLREMTVWDAVCV